MRDVREMFPRSPRPRLIRPGEREFEAKPIPLTCPLCAEELGAIVLMDPRLQYVQVEVECDVVEGRSGHRELHVKTLDLAKKEDQAAEAQPIPAPAN